MSYKYIEYSIRGKGGIYFEHTQHIFYLVLVSLCFCGIEAVFVKVELNTPYLVSVDMSLENLKIRINNNLVKHKIITCKLNDQSLIVK